MILFRDNGIMRITFSFIASICVIAIAAVTQSCHKKADRKIVAVTEDSVALCPLPDTLRVGTLYSPTSYFIFRDTEMGYDYDLAVKFAEDKGMVLKLEVATNLENVISLLDSGRVDLIAYQVPVTATYRDRAVPCGVESVTHQVLVQPKKSKEGKITDVTQLVGREVYVEANSKYHQRLINLNEELGGGIKIHPIERDTLITEDLIAMVSNGEIPLTVVDSHIAQLNKTYYPDIDVDVTISFPQRAAWAVAPSKAWLGDSIDAWTGEETPRLERMMLLKRYYEMSKSTPSIFTFNFASGRMSPFDGLFKKYASEIGWDWRLLASQGYTESRFDSTRVSWAGARGIMQLMPATARANGLDMNRISYNEPNIATAVKVIASLDRSLSHYVADKEERKKFVVAAYNSGLAHIIDAIRLAKKLGIDATRWDGCVSRALLLKSNPEYFHDPVVKHGYFRGRQTTEYVKSVYNCYEKAKRQIPA